MKIKYLNLARLEFHESIAFYESEQKGLGEKFENEIKSTISRIKQSPKMYPNINIQVKKCIVNKFPFNILYSIEKGYILIIAVAHHHREPDYWIDRIIEK